MRKSGRDYRFGGGDRLYEDSRSHLFYRCVREHHQISAAYQPGQAPSIEVSVVELDNVLQAEPANQVDQAIAVGLAGGCAYIGVGCAGDQVPRTRIEVDQVGQSLNDRLQAFAWADQTPCEYNGATAGDQRRTGEECVRPVRDYPDISGVGPVPKDKSV